MSDKAILVIVLINAIVIFLQESGIRNVFLSVVDSLCTVVFLIEMVVKQRVMGMKGYWKDGWNILDGTVTLLSLPSLMLLLFPDTMVNLTFLQVLRVMRLLKLIRAGRFFTNISGILRGFKLAIRESAAVLVAFLIVMVIVAVFNCCLFRNAAPEYFDTPVQAVYSMFRFFTVEGWYEIPDAVTSGSSPTLAFFIRLYFCLLVFGGGVIGMSLINSVFVDAMVADNNDGMQEQLNRMEEKLDRLEKMLSNGEHERDGE